MTLFNLSRWIAKEVTGAGDRDIKIYIIGPPASGKSKTAVALALKIKKWLSWYLYKDFEHQDEYFKFDSEHLAIISSDDLLKMMMTYPPMYQIRIVDDCGNTRGFDSRKSMSHENSDINSIWSTNRTRHCITIVTLHDFNFSDRRQVLIADIVIDLRGYTQSGRFRMAKIYKIGMDKSSNGNRGVRLTRFMTYENGQWVTQESLACELPPADICKQYDELRAAKDKENTEKAYQKYQTANSDKEVKDTRPRCTSCNSPRLYHGKKVTRCLNCGKVLN